MRTVTVPLQVLQLLEPRVLGAFMLDFIHALPYEASQRAQVLLADLLTDRGPMLPPGTTPLEQLLGLATVEPEAPALQAQLQGVADAAVEKAKGKRPSSRAVAQSDDEADDEAADRFVARQFAKPTDTSTAKPPRQRKSTAEVEELIRTAYGAGLRGVGLIAQSTGLGRTTVAAAVKRMQLEGVAT